MRSISRVTIFVGLGIGALAAVILFGSGGDEGTKESTLFKTNWEMIEYVPPADYYLSEEPQSETGPRDSAAKLAAGPKRPGAKSAKASEAPTPDEEDTKGRLALKFIRKPGLYRDHFEVLTPAGGVPGSREVRRRGSGAVRNIFTTWGKLVVKGVYSQAEAGDPVRLGLTGGASRVLLYGSRARSPVTVILGRKLKNGQMFIKSDQDGESLYLVPAGEEFRNTYLAYRERRVLLYPTKSHTARFTVKHAGQSVSLEQRLVEVKGTEQPEWEDSKGRKLANARVQVLENALKQASISRFPDEPDLLAYGDPESLWAKAEESLTAEVAIHGGDVVRIEYRIPQSPISPGGNRLVLLRNSLDGTVDFADQAQFDNLTRGLRDVIAEQERLDRVEKMRANPVKQKGSSGAPGAKSAPSATPSSGPGPGLPPGLTPGR